MILHVLTLHSINCRKASIDSWLMLSKVGLTGASNPIQSSKSTVPLFWMSGHE